ncbi:MAG: hypothetical protein ACXVIF_06000 [Halobacteriota archaeon]
MTRQTKEGHEDVMMRDSGVFTFRTQLQGLHHRTMGVFIDVPDKYATLTFARLEDEKEQAVTFKHLGEADLKAWGLTYQDLIDAFEEKDALSNPGWYPVTPKIAQAVQGHEAQAFALFDDQEQ